MDLGLLRRDGFTEYVLNDDDFVTSAETRKGKDGEQVATGVTKRVFLFRKTAAQVTDGEGVAAVLPDGKAAKVKELRIIERYLDADAVNAKAEADRVKNLVSNLRRYLGLGRSKKAVADRDRLTPKDVANWMNGDRTLFGKTFGSLPNATKDAVSKVYADSIKTKGEKPMSATKLAEFFALCAAEGKPIEQKYLDQLNAIKVKAAKLQKGKAEPEVTLTEQGTD